MREQREPRLSLRSCDNSCEPKHREGGSVAVGGLDFRRKISSTAARCSRLRVLEIMPNQYHHAPILVSASGPNKQFYHKYDLVPPSTTFPTACDLFVNGSGEERAVFC